MDTTNIMALTCSTIGSFFTALGLITMKISNIKIEKNKNLSTMVQPMWLLGLLFMTLS